MRLGLSGSHRVGKTTLAEAISARFDVPFLKTTTSDVFRNSGLDPSRPMDFESRLQIQNKILDAAEAIWGKNHQSFITDRTPLDMAAYTLADIQGNTPVNFVELNRYISKCIIVTNTYFDKIILIQPGIPLVYEDGKASLNHAYIEHLNYLLLGLITDHRLTCKTHIIDKQKISIDDRLLTVENAIRTQL